ncbi:MaoC/PaaZ C-terminal domain-containing protein [Actinomyces sp. oral taxon 414]|uniref:MaoC/PaaZ C-terminal domain-containing protein n=1 Tax=Actinomyces sp. oral taxon 414 TaxID=712122 RepID=UPI00209FDCFB|nr:MaoC/PaaZ C-terminal domain-containing protein [Actinomyces sp. oral taxon 414]
MSAPGPVELASAGLRRVPDRAGMTRVVARILARDARFADPQRCARSGVEAILPAVLGLVRARSSIPAGDRDGLVHRRCRIRPRPDGGAPPPLAPRSMARAGWELTVVVVHVDRWEVTHWLARHLERTGGAGVEGVGADGGPRARVENDGARLEPSAGRSCSRVRIGGGGARVGKDGLRAPDASATADVVARPRIDAADLSAWARAGADPNIIHLRPGAARAAGLAVGGDEAVAHGLLLAALSLAVVPLGRARGVDLRFTAPVAVSLAGGPTAVSVTGRGDLADRRGTALRRTAASADDGAGEADGS